MPLLKQEGIQNVSLPLNGRRIVVGDIHGCFYSLRALLENKVQLTPEDQLFLLGDYINRGFYSAKILDYIIALKAQNYQVYPLRGNHEQMFLQAYGCGTAFFESFLAKYYSLDLINENLNDYLAFCDSLKYVITTENFLLTHLPLMHNGKQATVQISTIFPEAKFTFPDQINQTIIHGHQAVTITKIKNDVVTRSNTINLDGGCVYASNPELGYLCALELDHYQLYIQQNIDT